MKTKVFIYAVLAVSIVAGCARETYENPVETQGYDILHASIETPSASETKSYVGEGLRVLWDEGDAASVFKFITANQKYTYSGEAGTNDGDFVNSSSGSGSSLDLMYAVYPYSAGISMSGDGTIKNVSIPKDQTYRENSFGRGNNVSVSCGDSPKTLFFKNLCGFVRLRLYGNGVTVSKVVLESNNSEAISGTGTISVSAESDPSFAFTSGYSDITLNCPGGVTLGTSASNATDFWFAIPPVKLSNGFKITVYEYGTAAKFVKKASASFTVERNLLKNMAALEVVPAVSYEIPEAVDLGLSVKWASFDVGATASSSRAELIGYTFKWGETEECSNNDYSYKWGYWDDENYQIKDITKYCNLPEYGHNGFTDGKTRLDPEDDAATVNLGSNWRTPTMAEWRELFANTTSDISPNGTAEFKSTVPGYTDKSIFFADYDCNYMTSSLYPDNPGECYFAAPEIVSQSVISSIARNYTFYVRAVQGDEVTASSISFNQSTYTVKRGQTVKLTPTILPAAAGSLPITWKSSNTSWATVDSEGNVTGMLKNKTVTITASVGSVSATCNVKVTAPDLVSFTLSPSSISMFPLDKAKVTAVLNPSDAEVSTSQQYWYIDAERIAGVGEGGDYWRYINAWETGSAVLKVVLNGIEKNLIITVLDPAPTAVDLGLSVQWGDRNFFANQVTGPGRYYYFADAIAYNGTDSDVAEYFTDGKWRLPTKSEVEELLDNTKCTHVQTTQDGATGIRFTSKTTGKSIFLPDVGGYLQSTYYGPSQMGCSYWTGSTEGTSCYRLNWYTSSHSPAINIVPDNTWNREYQFVFRPVKAN